MKEMEGHHLEALYERQGQELYEEYLTKNRD